MNSNPDLNPTPEARIAMSIWNNEYAYGSLGSMGFWNSLSPARQRICIAALAEVASAAIAHGRSLEELATPSPEASSHA